MFSSDIDEMPRTSYNKGMEQVRHHFSPYRRLMNQFKEVLDELSRPRLGCHVHKALADKYAPRGRKLQALIDKYIPIDRELQESPR